jgi:hypothetical protein
MTWVRLKYILLYGVLAFGGFTFALDICSEVFFDHKQLSTSSLTEKAIQWSLAGIAFGIGSLLQSERHSREMQSSGSSEGSDRAL